MRRRPIKTRPLSGPVLPAALLMGLLLTALVLSPARTLLSFYLAAVAFVSIPVGGTLMLAISRLTHTRWLSDLQNTLIRIAGWQPTTSIIFLAALIPSLGLFPWWGSRASLPLFQQVWLHPLFFLARTFFYLGLWVYFSRQIAGAMASPEPPPKSASNSVRLSAGFLPVFGVTFWLAMLDWIMSLSPDWQTTLFAFYHFSGLLLTVAAATVVLSLFGPLRERSQPAVSGGESGPVLTRNSLRPTSGAEADERQGRSCTGPPGKPNQPFKTGDHKGRPYAASSKRLEKLDSRFQNSSAQIDLARFLLYSSCLWAYLWFCLYMLIWYAGIPAESAFVVRRIEASWSAVFWIVPVLSWLVPFSVLLAGKAKRNPDLLLLAAGTVLAGRWLDTYLMIFPTLESFDLLRLPLDFAPTLVLLGLFSRRAGRPPTFKEGRTTRSVTLPDGR